MASASGGQTDNRRESLRSWFVDWPRYRTDKLMVATAASYVASCCSHRPSTPLPYRESRSFAAPLDGDILHTVCIPLPRGWLPNKTRTRRSNFGWHLRFAPACQAFSDLPPSSIPPDGWTDECIHRRIPIYMRHTHSVFCIYWISNWEFQCRFFGECQIIVISYL